MGPAIVAGAAVLSLLLSLLLLRAWVSPASPPPPPVRRVTVLPAPSPSPTLRAPPSPSPPPVAAPSPTVASPPPAAAPSPRPSRPPRTVLTPTPVDEPVEVPTAAPEPSPEFVEVPLDAPSPAPSPSEEAPAEGPLAVDARLDRWPADGPDPAVRVRLVVANPSASAVTIEHAEVVFLNPTGNLGADRQDLGAVAAGTSEEVWFYYGNAARFWDVRAQLRLVYRGAGQTFVVEREVK